MFVSGYLSIRSGAKKKTLNFGRTRSFVSFWDVVIFFLGGGFYFGILWPPQKKTELNGEADGRCPNDVRKTNSDVINRDHYIEMVNRIKEIQNSN